MGNCVNDPGIGWVNQEAKSSLQRDLSADRRAADLSTPVVGRKSSDGKAEDSNA